MPREEAEISAKFQILQRGFDLLPDEIGAGLEFFAKIRAAKTLSPASCGDVSSESAHQLAIFVADRMAEIWQICCEIAARSQSKPQYLYSSTAANLFSKTWMSKNHPKPQDLLSMVELEHQAAQAELDRRDLEMESTGRSVDVVVVTAGRVTVNSTNELVLNAVKEQPIANSFRREGKVWQLSYSGKSVAVPDAAGMSHLARLLAQPGRDICATEFISSDSAAIVQVQGPREPVADTQALREVHDRMRDLDRDIDLADRNHDAAAKSSAVQEKEKLLQYLSADVVNSRVGLRG